MNRDRWIYDHSEWGESLHVVIEDDGEIHIVLHRDGGWPPATAARVDSPQASEILAEMRLSPALAAELCMVLEDTCDAG